MTKNNCVHFEVIRVIGCLTDRCYTGRVYYPLSSQYGNKNIPPPYLYRGEAAGIKQNDVSHLMGIQKFKLCSCV